MFLELGNKSKLNVKTNSKNLIGHIKTILSSVLLIDNYSIYKLERATEQMLLCKNQTRPK